MTGTATLSTYLTTGDIIDFRGKQYLILKRRSAKNYEGRGPDGKDYLIPTEGNYNIVARDAEKAWSIVEEKSAPSLSEATFGTPVRITTGKFAGMVGILAHETSSKYYIAFLGQGTIAVPRTSKNIEAVTKEEFLAYASR